MKKVNWRKCEDTKLDETAEIPLILEKEFPDLPDCEPLTIFQCCLLMEIITMIRKESSRHAKSKNIHSFGITEKDIMNFLGILIISCSHTIPSKKQYWSTRPSLVAPIYPEIMRRSRFSGNQEIPPFSQ